MARRKRTQRRGATLAAAAAAAAALAFTAPSVSAHYDTSNRDRVPSSYTTVWDCTWQFDSGVWTDNVTVHIATGSASVPDPDMNGLTRDWPPATTQDGRSYNFKSRIRNAVFQWNSALQSTDAGAGGLDYINGDANYTGGLYWHQIVVYYYNPPGKTVDEPPGAGTGHTYPAIRMRAEPRPGGDRDCGLNASSDSRTTRAALYIPTYSNWHTADERADWETCAGRDPGGPYLCTKDIDLQSIVAHELGHSFGMAHPASDRLAWSHCQAPRNALNRPVDAASLCGWWRFTTAQRTAYPTALLG
jgi:hypothetical protein